MSFEAAACASESVVVGCVGIAIAGFDRISGATGAAGLDPMPPATITLSRVTDP